MKKIFVFLIVFGITSTSFATPFHPLPSGINHLDTNPLSFKKFEDMLSEFACEKYEIKSFKNEEAPQGVKKSQGVQEIFFILSKKENVEIPLSAKMIRFFDLDSTESFYEASQVLRALHILETPDGYFGKKNEKDPVITIHEMEEMLHRTFVDGLCDFSINTDRDSDGIEGLADRCPNLPAKDSLDGCPPILFAPQKTQNVPKLKVVLPESKSTGMTFLEKVQIKIGDIFKAVFLNPKTQEVLKESNTKKVEQ